MTGWDEDLAALPPARPPGPAERARWTTNDRDNGRRLVAACRDSLLYLPGRGWATWTGTHYDFEAGDAGAMEEARCLSDLIAEEAEALEAEGAEAKRVADRRKAAVSSGNSSRVRAALDMARFQLRVRPDRLDHDRTAMQVPNGTLDLEALADEPPDAEEEEERIARWQAALGRHRRDGLPTRVGGARFDPEADCPGWRRFVRLVMPDPVDALYLQRCMGMLLGGQRGEKALVLLGKGGNGKSTLIKGIERVLGGYAQPCRIELFCETRGAGQGPTPEEAVLPGARAYLAAEPDIAVTLSASKIKGLTGGNTRLAHAKGKDPFSWMPVGVPVLQANEMPRVNDPSEGFWRRVEPVLFRENLAALPAGERLSSWEADAMIGAELPGILNWLIQGWIEYRAIGLCAPAPVEALKGSLRALADPVGAFLDEACVQGTGLAVRTSTLHAAFREWCETGGDRPMSGKAFTAAMLARDYLREKRHGGHWHWVGIDLAAQPDEEAAQ